MCPQGRKAGTQRGIFLPQEARRTSLQQFHEPMNAKLKIPMDEQMDMIGHHFQFFYSCMIFHTCLLHNLLQSFIYPVYQDFTPILRAPNHMVDTSEIDVSVRLIFSFHIYQYTATTYLASSVFR